MALDTAATMKNNIEASLRSSGFNITTGNGFDNWVDILLLAICTEFYTQLTTKAQIIPGAGGTDTGQAGAGMISPAKVT